MGDRSSGDRVCVYCGVPIVKGVACNQHAAIALRDPNVGGLRRPLSERELGVRLPWPEGEAVDDGGEE